VKVPQVSRLDSKILNAVKKGGQLSMGSWHACGTTHCRAGWAITLAGCEGSELETALGPGTAGALIYAKAYPEKSIPIFYASDKEAMASIRESAKAESKK
jgi:hypothetical protein